MTAQESQYTHGEWYWVEKEGRTSKEVIFAPACYCAAFDSWHSYTFSGVATRYVKVLEPCTRAQPVARPPLTPYTLREIIKKLNANHYADGWNFGDLAHEVEIYHGIAQEKQG